MAINQRDLKALFATFPTGVTVVATAHTSGIHGATVASFLGVSLDPPIILISLRREARMCAIIKGKRFSVSVLSHTQANLARHFSASGGMLDQIDWSGPDGTLLAGAASHMSCDPWQTVEVGDHLLVMGRVQDGEVFDQQPLIYHRGIVGDRTAMTSATA